MVDGASKTRQFLRTLPLGRGCHLSIPIFLILAMHKRQKTILASIAAVHKDAYTSPHRLILWTTMDWYSHLEERVYYSASVIQ